MIIFIATDEPVSGSLPAATWLIAVFRTFERVLLTGRLRSFTLGRQSSKPIYSRYVCTYHPLLFAPGVFRVLGWLERRPCTGTGNAVEVTYLSPKVSTPAGYADGVDESCRPVQVLSLFLPAWGGTNLP